MKVSIIIVNYKTSKLTISAIRSVYESKPKVQFEVIVVDNGSMDGSLHKFKKLKLPFLKVIDAGESIHITKDGSTLYVEAKDIPGLINKLKEIQTERIGKW